MQQDKFWQKAFQRYVEGKAKPAEKKLLDGFFHHHQKDISDIWSQIHDDPEEIRRRVYDQIQQQIRSAPKRNIFKINDWVWVASACMLIFTSFGYFYFNHIHTTASRQPAAQYKQIVTGRGEQRTTTLPDGSLVHLNYESQLKFDESQFNRQERKVYLEGEAFFEVRRDRSIPFLVITGQLSTKVLGTSFNVNAYDSTISVTVARGKVKVSNIQQHKEASLTLTAAEQACLNLTTNELARQKVSLQNEFLWRQGILQFDALPISEAFKRLERWYDVKISYAPTIKDKKISARYEKQDLDQVLNSIAFLLDLRYKINTDQSILFYHP